MRRGPNAAGWESCPAGAWLASPTSALPHSKPCWGLTAPCTHSPGAGCQHPGCTEPRRGLVLGNRSLLSPFHPLLPSWDGVSSLAPSPAAESSYKAAHPPAGCCPGWVAPSAAPAYAARWCGWGVAPTHRAGDCGGPRALLGDVPRPWFVVCKSWKAVTFMGCGRAGGSQEGCPSAPNKLQLWGRGRKAALSESFVLQLLHLFPSLAPCHYEKARGGLEGFSLMFMLRRSTGSSPPQLSWEVQGGPPPLSCCSEP